MNALLTVEASERPPLVVEYIPVEDSDASDGDAEQVLSVTLEFEAGADLHAADLWSSEEPLQSLSDGSATAVQHDDFVDAEVPVFDDEFPLLSESAEAAGDEEPDAAPSSPDPRLIEMSDVLVTLRDSEVSHALRLLRHRFPHIPFPFRVRALMAVRHGAMVG